MRKHLDVKWTIVQTFDKAWTRTKNGQKLDKGWTNLSHFDYSRCREHDGDRVERRHAPLLLRLLAVHPVPPPVHREVDFKALA